MKRRMGINNQPLMDFLASGEQALCPNFPKAIRKVREGRSSPRWERVLGCMNLVWGCSSGVEERGYQLLLLRRVQ